MNKNQKLCPIPGYTTLDKDSALKKLIDSFGKDTDWSSAGMSYSRPQTSLEVDDPFIWILNLMNARKAA